VFNFSELLFPITFGAILIIFRLSGHVVVLIFLVLRLLLQVVFENLLSAGETTQVLRCTLPR
jgi:hypothetical protein